MWRNGDVVKLRNELDWLLTREICPMSLIHGTKFETLNESTLHIEESNIHQYSTMAFNFCYCIVCRFVAKAKGSERVSEKDRRSSAGVILRPRPNHVELGWVTDMSKYYVESGATTKACPEFTACRPLPSEEVMQKACDLCRKPIVELHRYGRRINFAQLSA
ncbi:LOW QUALITY PROTEIN: hypothetical protein BC937DRAFT_89976 [Endogone sp. FLAS-F59071]|nr:LOW QUALITY PROTEIN: hypothetical protein BC937DRAFT_89976 [Endogone sp. FLAS-F59071]|eukprot:RUS17443.1 LOW QUALITY PROTEIN: hypothetical protein BC937DRAFT_89976 [Endogone sp. FLAS-F59071]